MDARTVQLITQEALAEKIARQQLELRGMLEKLAGTEAELAEAKKPKTRSRRK